MDSRQKRARKSTDKEAFDDNPSALKRPTEMTHDTLTEGGPLDLVVDELRKDHKLLLAMLYLFDCSVDGTYACALSEQKLHVFQVASGAESPWAHLYVFSHLYFFLANGIPLESLTVYTTSSTVHMRFDDIALNIVERGVAHDRWARQFDLIDPILRPLCFMPDTGAPLYNYGVYLLLRLIAMACIDEYKEVDIASSEAMIAIAQYLTLMETKLMMEAPGAATMKLEFPRIELEIPFKLNGKQSKFNIHLRFILDNEHLLHIHGCAAWSSAVTPLLHPTHVQEILLNWVKDGPRLAQWAHTLARLRKDGQEDSFASVTVAGRSKFPMTGMTGMPFIIQTNHAMHGEISVSMAPCPMPVPDDRFKEGDSHGIWIMGHVTGALYGPFISPVKGTEVPILVESLIDIKFNVQS